MGLVLCDFIGITEKLSFRPIAKKTANKNIQKPRKISILKIIKI